MMTRESITITEMSKSDAVRALADYQERYEAFEGERDRLILEAFGAGIPGSMIGPMVRLTPQRCYQIRDEYQIQKTYR